MSNVTTDLNCNVQKMQIAICREMCCNYNDKRGKSVVFPGALNG